MRIIFSKFLIIPLLLIGFGVFIFFYFKNTEKISEPKNIVPTKMTPDAQEVPESSETTESTEVLINDKEIVDKPITWKVYDSTDFSKKTGWSGFKLHYPSNWILSEQKNEETPDYTSLILTISKTNGDYFEIIQGMGGGGYCLFPDEKDYDSFEGMGTKYPKYIEIKKSNDIVWRLADWPYSSTMWTHTLCELRKLQGKDRFFDSTKIGFTKVKVTADQSVQELKQILNKIVISN